MEKFNQQFYRDDLAKELKEVRQDDPEKAREILGEAKKTEAYKSAESRFMKLKELDKEAQLFFEEYKDAIEEVNSETADRRYFSVDEDFEKFDLLRKKSKGYRSELSNLGADVLKGEYFARDYAQNHGTDYTDEFSRKREILSKNKRVYEKLGIFLEARKAGFVGRIKNDLENNSLIPHDTFRSLEFLAVAGLSGELMNELKAVLLEAGNANVLRKFSEEFPVSFSQDEINIALQNAIEKKSLFDVSKIIEILGEGNVDPAAVEQRDLLSAKVKEKFTENCKIIEAGVKNKDFLLHFTGTPYLGSILKNGILSNLDQSEHFGKSNSGQGNDLQAITGRLDCVSVYDVYKGSNKGEKDSQIYREMKRKIRLLMSRYLEENYGQINPACIFEVLAGSQLVQTWTLGGNIEQIIRDQYTELVTVSDTSESYINPNEVNKDGSYHRATISRTDNKVYETFIHGDGELLFDGRFFKDWNEAKKELIESIKELMRDAYTESNQEEENKKGNLDSFERQVMWITRAKNPTFLLNPSMDRTFIQSAYDGESFVEGSISPDKILGAFANNAHLERVCYNEGMVVIDYKSKEELSDEQRANILFETPNGAIFIKDLYK